MPADRPSIGAAGGIIRRREFIGLFSSAAASPTWPLPTGRAQQAAKTIGFLGPTTPAPQWVAVFVKRLRELGWTEGQEVSIEYRWAEGRPERSRRVQRRVRPSQGRCRGHFRNAGSACGQAGNGRDPHRLRVRRRSGRHRPCREPGAPGRQCHWLLARVRSSLPASGSSSCAKLSPPSRGWRRWPMSAFPRLCWRWAKCKPRPKRSASTFSPSTSDGLTTSRPRSTGPRAAWTRSMSAVTR